MKRSLLFSLAMIAAAFPLSAQIRLNLDAVAAKASDSVDISLDQGMLKLAAAFLGRKPADKSQNDADVQKVVSGLKNITVKSYTFAQEGAYQESDVEPIRAQLRAAGWSRMIGVHEKGNRGSTDIFDKTEGGQIAGIAVVAAEPKELTVVYIEGVIDLAKLASLAGQFGIPDLPIPGQQKKGTDQ